MPQRGWPEFAADIGNHNVVGPMIISNVAKTVPRQGVMPLIGYAFLWYVLTGGDLASWVVGVPTILTAVAVSLAQRGRRWSLSLRGAGRFAVVFLVESLKGGLDVSVRVLRPRVRVAPALFDYATSLLREPPARNFFVLCAGLLPGTLVTSIEDNHLVVHTLDASAPMHHALARLERAVAGLFLVDSASETEEEP